MWYAVCRDRRKCKGDDLSQSRPAWVATGSKGSDFQAFMHERYVPGTWSKIAALREHVPRQRLAKPLVAGKTRTRFRLRHRLRRGA